MRRDHSHNITSRLMDLLSEIHGFSNRCRLFPLPGLVLLPHALLPLHIFEPRYRQMTHDALASDQLITMVQIRPTPRDSPWTEPVPIMDVACLGKIIRHERLPDGRFNILLQGCHRVRLIREIPTEKLYRVAEAQILADIEPSQPSEPRLHQLIDLFRAIHTAQNPLPEELSRLLNSPLSLAVATDLIAHALNLPPLTKQALLAEPSVDARANFLLQLLEHLAQTTRPRPSFPPPFSAN